MLDVGGEFLKMLEEDWGKKPRKTASLLILLFIAVFTIHFTLAWLFVPIYQFILDVSGNKSLYELLKHDLVSIILSFVISTTLVFLTVGTILRWYRSRLNKTLNDATAKWHTRQTQVNALMAKVEQNMVLAEQKYSESEKGYERIKEEATRAVEKAEKILVEVVKATNYKDV